ncbi:MAG: peptidoglycan DD-metalloendopeptidase family protein [Saprospiraceae bacterium]
MSNPSSLFTPFKGASSGLIYGILAFSLLALLAMAVFPENSKNAKANLRGSRQVVSAFPIVVPTVRFGFALDTFSVEEGEVAPGQILGEMLTRHGIGHDQITRMLEEARGTFRVQDFKTGKPYLLLARSPEAGLDYFIYEPSVYEYFIFHFKGEPRIEKVVRPVEVRQQFVEGTISSSLWQALEDGGASPALIAKMEDALQWSIDFHHLQEGDHFHALYDQQYVEGQAVDPGRVHAALYQTGEKSYHAIYYEHNGEKGYYDLEGRPVNKGFLKAPVKFSRISSHYNLRRFHPVLKHVRPHLGTDYAAPYGTEIYAVGNGEVIEASYGRGNGNYVKIRHNKQITTQYLHMRGFARGIRRGTRVSQGQVIGYVGATGLATGPHVCFRFWMNGKQVNHLKLNFPPPEPLPKAVLDEFFPYRDSLVAKLNNSMQVKAGSP